jgi:isocitrate dehydrogenase
MTKDIALLVEPGFNATAVNSTEFIDAIAVNLTRRMAAH